MSFVYKTFLHFAGYVGVVNRGQKALNGNIDLTSAKIKEMEFFNKHPVYSKMSNSLGSQFLQSHLNKVRYDEV